MRTSSRRTRGTCLAHACLGVCLSLGLGGCGRISVAPSCPPRLGVGETGTIEANVREPGAVPRYVWDVIPAEAGTVGDPTSPNTTFVGAQAGLVTLRLTAADGLFQFIDTCQIMVGQSAELAVSMLVNPIPPVAGQSATLTCFSVGDLEASTLTVVQIGGAPVVLSRVGEGAYTFLPNAGGALSFECTGTTGDGTRSTTTILGVTVSDTPAGEGPTRPGRG